MSKYIKATSLDIAYRAGVSQSTVSRALRDSPLVSQETRDKIKAIAREMNYKIDKNARNLRSQSTRTIALLMFEDPGSSTLINPFFTCMLSSITRATAIRDYDLLVSFQQLSEDWRADFEDANRADGLIFLGYGDYVTYQEKAHALLEQGAHFITWGPAVPGQPGITIASDNQLGGFLAAEHLIQQGRRQIAFIGNADEHAPEFRARYEGYCEALRKHGIEPNRKLQAAAPESVDSMGYSAVEQLLNNGMAFDAIFAATDLLAIGAMQALRKAGISVPNDVAVVGFDDIPAAQYVTPALSTIEQNAEAAGDILVDMLVRLINRKEDDPPIDSCLIPPRLIVRESCGKK